MTGFNTLPNIIKALRDVETAGFPSKPLKDMAERVGAVEKALRKGNLRKELRALEKKVQCRIRGLEAEIDHLKRKIASI